MRRSVNNIIIIFIRLLQDDMELKENNAPPDYNSIQIQQPPATMDERAAHETRRVLRGPLAPVNNALNFMEDGVRDFVKEQETHILIGAGVVCLIGYLIYFAFAVSLDAERATDLIYVTAFGFFCIIYWFLKKFFGETISKCFAPISNFFATRKNILSWYVRIFYIMLDYMLLLVFKSCVRVRRISIVWVWIF